MLQTLSARIRYCLHKAAEARRRAAESSDARRQQDLLRDEARWNLLARSEDFGERLRLFLASQGNAGETLGSARTGPSTPGSNRDRNTVNSGKRLIAIVDDDADVRDALKRLVCTLGYAAGAFAAAEEYLRSDLMCDTACLISDVHLPGMSGPDLQARLIADGYRIPIVFLTGFFDETVRTRVLKAGALDYLAKPCDAKSLFGCIEQALASVTS